MFFKSVKQWLWGWIGVIISALFFDNVKHSIISIIRISLTYFIICIIFKFILEFIETKSQKQ